MVGGRWSRGVTEAAAAAAASSSLVEVVVAECSGRADVDRTAKAARDGGAKAVVAGTEDDAESNTANTVAAEILMIDVLIDLVDLVGGDNGRSAGR